MPVLADFESDVIFEVAEALRVPVMVLTVLALVVVIVELGGFAMELARRRRRNFRRLELVTAEAQRKLAEHSDYLGAQESLKDVASSASMGATLSFVVSQWHRPGGEGKMAKALADFDFGSLKRLERTRMLVRIGPALGLMGTLIPLSPALAGLASGDVQELTDNLRVAFSVTVLGLLIGAVAFGISLVRDRLYGQDLSDLEFVANALSGTPPSGGGPAISTHAEAEQTGGAPSGTGPDLGDPQSAPAEQGRTAPAGPRQSGPQQSGPQQSGPQQSGPQAPSPAPAS